MTQSAVQINNFRAPMHTDCSLTSSEMAQTPTILPDVPGGKERPEVSQGQISRDFWQTSGDVFRALISSVNSRWRSCRVTAVCVQCQISTNVSCFHYCLCYHRYGRVSSAF